MKLFKWYIDEDNDIVLSIGNIIHITKYKDSTIISFGKRSDLKPAPTYIKCVNG